MRRTGWRLVLPMIGLVIGTPARAAEPVAEIPLSPYVGKLRTIPLTVGGVERTFLFDTAGGITCVIPEITAEVGCEPWGRGTGFRHSGEPIHAEWCGDMSVEAGGVALTVEVSVFDLMPLLGNAPPVDGIASVHTFRDRPFTIDFDGGMVILESGASLEERIRHASELSARFAHQAGGASVDPFVEVRAEVGTLWMELDSGNIGRTILAPQVPAQLGIPAETDAAPLEVVGLGPVSLSLRVKDPCIYDGVLSVEIFEGRTFTFDPVAGRIWSGPR